MEKIYAKGLFAKRNEKAPEFVICSLSVQMILQFLKENTNEKGYVNLQVLKRSKEKGTLYAVVDTFEPKGEYCIRSKKSR